MQTKKSYKMLATVVVVAMLLTMINVVSVNAATAIDISVASGNLQAEVAGAIWQQFPGDNSSGTGNFNTYLSMQAQGNNTYECGYNSNRDKCEFDEKKTWTKALPLSAVPLVQLNADGPWYREFVVDVNQTTGNNLLSLDQFQVWQTNEEKLAGYNEGTLNFPAGATKIYDIKSHGDVYLILDYLVNSGSGWHDYRVLIPNSVFDQNVMYVTMFARHGDVYRADDGFEEWGVRGINTYNSETTTLLYKYVDDGDDIPLPNLPGENLVLVGDTIYDTVTVTVPGQSLVATGLVQFQYQEPGSATWIDLGEPVALDGTGKATSINHEVDKTGTYYFRARYFGGGNIISSESGAADEPLVVNKHDSRTTTLLKKVVAGGTDISLPPSDNDVLIGTIVYDTVEVDGNYITPTGTVQFQVKVPGGSWADLGTPVSLSGGVARSQDYTVLLYGTYYFRAIYSGDANYNESRSGEMDEPLDVEKHDSETTTLLYKKVTEGDDISLPLGSHTILIGTTVYDTVEVEGSYSIKPTGTVQFQVKFEDGIWADLGVPVSLENGEAKSADYTATATGTYYFRAIYSGDANYNESRSGEMDEPLDVDKHDSRTTTLLKKVVAGGTDISLPPSDNDVLIGTIVYDTVEVDGDYVTPTGTVQFQVKVPGGSWADLGTPVSLSGGVARSQDYTVLLYGTYYFRAIYSGDANYNESRSGEMDEPLDVDKHDSRTTTLLKKVVAGGTDISLPPSDNDVLIGTIVYDTVEVDGDYITPTGTVQFQVKVPGGSWADLGTPVSLSDGVARSQDYTVLLYGTYYFRAIYSGDANYNESRSGEMDEPLDVDKHDSNTSTLLYKVESIGDDRSLPNTQGDHTVLIGAIIYDIATVSGSYDTPTGTVQFQIKLPGGSWVDFGDPVALIDGKAKSDNHTVLYSGTYYFKAIYSGDANYYGSESGDEDEPVDVDKHESNTTTMLYLSVLEGNDIQLPIGSNEVLTGDVIYDTAMVSGSYLTPTGTVQFQIMVPGSLIWEDLGTEVALDSEGKARSIDYTVTMTGTYYFRAIYSGDDNYIESQSGDGEEPLIAIQRRCFKDETAWAFGGMYANAIRDYVKSSNWGWTNGPLNEGKYEFDIYAGAGANKINGLDPVGKLIVVYSGGNVTVTYELKDGYYLGEVHLHVGKDPLPKIKGKYTNAPGQFPYGDYFKFDPYDETTYTSEWAWSSADAGVTFRNGIYIAAHAVVYMETECPLDVLAY